MAGFYKCLVTTHCLTALPPLKLTWFVPEASFQLRLVLTRDGQRYDGETAKKQRDMPLGIVRHVPHQQSGQSTQRARPSLASARSFVFVAFASPVGNYAQFMPGSIRHVVAGGPLVLPLLATQGCAAKYVALLPIPPHRSCCCQHSYC